MTDELKSQNEFLKRYPALEVIGSDLVAAFELLKNSIHAGGKILTCGNGGSAADAEHIVGELVKSFLYNRPINELDHIKLKKCFLEEADSISKNLEGAIPAICLMSPVSLNSAFANDMSFDFALAQQVYALGKPNDVLIAISTSGNSKNVLNACKVAKIKGVKILALTGQHGGKLKALSDICICVPSTKVHEIQEYHLPVYHWLCYTLEEHFFGKYGLKENTTPVTDILNDRNTKKIDKENIDLIVMDFDGVFTDNLVFTLQDGGEAVVCSRADGLGMDMLRESEIPLMILSTESNPVIEARAKKLKVPCHFDCKDKKSFLERYLTDHGLDPNKVIYIGNDVNDLDSMKFVGTSVCPQDSHPIVLRNADYILQHSGGRGAVREFAEMICSDG